MKEIVEFLKNVRIVVAEVGGTLGLIFLMFYGGYKAWKEFVEKPLRSYSRRTPRPATPSASSRESGEARQV
jgi:hypothetical protein